MDDKKYQPKWDCDYKDDMKDDMMEDDYEEDMDCGCAEYKPYKPMCAKPEYPMPHMHHMHHMQPDCDMPMMKCKTEKTCVKTYKCYYKMYKLCTYRLYKVCPRCSHEFDYYRHGTCPKCR